LENYARACEVQEPVNQSIMRNLSKNVEIINDKVCKTKFMQDKVQANVAGQHHLSTFIDYRDHVFI